MYKVKLIVEYHGKYFSGWQEQRSGVVTIQGELTKALSLFLKEQIPFVDASGRTDAGVHARSLVAVFQCVSPPNLEKLPYAVSSILKNKIAVLDAELVDDSFNPRRDAVLKQYSYHILNRPSPPTYQTGFVLHITSKLDIPLMQMSAKVLEGRYDFNSFRAAECRQRSTVKTIYSSEILIKEYGHIVYQVRGSGFLQHMVRIIVGTLVMIGRGKITRPMQEILAAKNRSFAGQTAPAYGLFLDYVEYR
jgi:tRNA pseudouridine38-40 synthase